MQQPVCGYFGKLPWHGDFLREAPANAPIDLFDAWLAPAPIGPPGPASAAFDAAGPALAAVRSRGHWWAMALFPSQDAVGRRFPFCAFAGLPEAEFAGEAGVVPVAWAPFLVRCLQTAARGWPGNPAALTAAVAACAQPIDIDGEAHRLVESLADRRASALWAAVCGGDARRRDGLWADLMALARDPGETVGFRLAPMAHQLDLAFLLMAQRLIGQPASSPVLIGMHPGRPGEAASAGVLWGRPSAAECLAALWPAMPGVQTARIHDLAARPGTIGDPDDAPEALADPEMALRDLLHSLGSATRRITRRPT
jgi:type VI secretion system ImpM family protein